jgi:hypothetical protein
VISSIASHITTSPWKFKRFGRAITPTYDITHHNGPWVPQTPLNELFGKRPVQPYFSIIGEFVRIMQQFPIH